MELNEIEEMIAIGLVDMYKGVELIKKIEEALGVTTRVVEYTTTQGEALVQDLLASYYLVPDLDTEARINYLIGVDFSVQEDISIGWVEEDENLECTRRFQKLKDIRNDLPPERINAYTHMGIVNGTMMTKMIMDEETGKGEY